MVIIQLIQIPKLALVATFNALHALAPLIQIASHAPLDFINLEYNAFNFVLRELMVTPIFYANLVIQFVALVMVLYPLIAQVALTPIWILDRVY